ncbi:MAG: sodium/glutamate symporter [Gammaproteobacteria bacterium]|jgi:ESS family glutamate:Na+ symporter
MTLDAVQTLAVAGVVAWLGQLVCRRVDWLARLSIPGPVVGGLAVAISLLALRSAGMPAPEFDTTFQKTLLVAFFATLGFGARLDLLRRGGPQVLVFLMLCAVFAVLQSLVGIIVAQLFGLPSLFGVLVGVTTLSGGPATGAAFAPQFEAAGVAGAGAIAVASAMSGIVLGGLLGGPLAVRLMRRNGMVSSTVPQAAGQVPLASAAPDGSSSGLSAVTDEVPGERRVFASVVLLLVVIVAGQWVSAGIERLGITLPGYIGAMLLAAIAVNGAEALGRWRPSIAVLDMLGAVALSLFLAMWLMTLDLRQLHAVAGALLVNLALQVVLIAALIGVVFRVMGRDHDAAVMSGGFTGFMLGTTATALAVMRALVERHGAAPRAFLVAPLVGAFFLDFVNAIIITTFLNLLG